MPAEWEGKTSRGEVQLNRAEVGGGKNEDSGVELGSSRKCLVALNWWWL